MDEQKEIKIGNLYGFTGGNYAGNVYDQEGLSPCLSTFQGGNQQPLIIEKSCVAMRGRNPDHPTDSTSGIPTEQRLEKNENGTVNTLTSVQKDNLILEKIQIRQATTKGAIDCSLPGLADLSYPTSETRRGRVQEEGQICPTITAAETNICYIENGSPDNYTLAYEDNEFVYYIRVRKLTPRECWRLMGFSDDDFNKAEAVNSNTQLYKQAGNSIVKNVLVALIKQMYQEQEEEENEPEQMTIDDWMKEWEEEHGETE